MAPPTHLGRSKKCLWARLGRQDASKIEANLGASWPPKPSPKWRPTWAPKNRILILGRVLAALGHHRLFIWSSYWSPFPDPGGQEKIDFVIKSLLKSVFCRPPGFGKRVQQGLQKNSLWRPRAAKIPPKMEANFSLKNRFLRAQVGFHFGEGLGGPWAPYAIFFEACSIPFLDPVGKKKLIL